MQILRRDGSRAQVAAAGVELEIGLDLVEGAGVGDWVIVHAGYAITRLSEEEAHETLAILERLEASWQP
jgi:hydrogenase expression/formation protein HypC